MKVKELILRNYKGFGADAPPISFVDDLGNVNPVTVLVGPNGSGKSSVLQAIAMLVGSAARRRMQPDLLDWPGFDFEYIRNGRALPEAKVTIQFTKDEILATKEYAEVIRLQNPALVPPGEQEEIFLELDFRNARVFSDYPKHFFQGKGYEYALQLNGGESSLIANLKRVGGIYWYTEQRTATSIIRAIESGTSEGQVSISDEKLRSILLSWTSFHDMTRRPRFQLRDGQRDRFAELERLFTAIFPGRSLVGSIPHPSPERQSDASPFWLRNERGQEYELSSMSGAERAILPLLIDFTTWEIHNSIILIDEIELHLHPPLQQALVRALPKLGKNNQFIITTHSDYVVGMFGDSQIIRLS